MNRREFQSKTLALLGGSLALLKPARSQAKPIEVRANPAAAHTAAEVELYHGTICFYDAEKTLLAQIPASLQREGDLLTGTAKGHVTTAGTAVYATVEIPGIVFVAACVAQFSGPHVVTMNDTHLIVGGIITLDPIDIDLNTRINGAR